MAKKRELKYTEAIKEATDLCLKEYPTSFIIGPGVPDPKGTFGTTLKLVDKYGQDRVLDMPLSENGITGICIGAALTGMRPILVHQRIDFTLLALDEIVNNAAKWHYMFGGISSIPMVVRTIIGRGWGQGSQHSQNLQALYTHIPGLKVIMPSTPYDAKGLFISSVVDNNPIIFIDHRWLYNITGYVPEGTYQVPIGKAKIIRKGSDITIASTSYMTLESIKASKIIEKEGVDPELIDIRTLKPLDSDTIIKSVRKTGRFMILDSGWKSGGFASEVITKVVENTFTNLKTSPQRICLPDIPTPTTRGLTRYYYPNTKDIVQTVLKMLEWKSNDIKSVISKSMKREKNIPWDIPDLTFTGPF